MTRHEGETEDNCGQKHERWQGIDVTEDQPEESDTEQDCAISQERIRVRVGLPNRVWSWGKFAPRSLHSDSCLDGIERRPEQRLDGEIFCFV